MSMEPSESGPASAGSSREYRAAATFLISGTFTLLVLLLYQGVLQSTPPIRGVVAVGGVLLGMAAMLAAAVGLATGRGWAVAAMTPMLVVLAIAGVAQLLWALSQRSIDSPLGALLALWALRAPVRTRPATGLRASTAGIAGVVVLVALLVSASMPALGGLLLQPGGPLIAGEDALRPSLVVTCGDSPGNQPTFLSVAYDWRWSRGEPLVAGTDTITLSWYAIRDDDATGYELDPPGQLSAGIAEANVLIGRRRGLVFSVDLAARGFEPGALRVSLSPSGAPPVAHGTVEVSAYYLHAPAHIYGPDSPATWRVHSTALCEW